MADALDAVLQLRRERQARDAATADSISQGFSNFTDNAFKAAQLQQTAKTNQINELLAIAKIAQLPQDALIKRGQAADAIMKQVEAGIMTPEQAQTQLGALNTLQTQANLTKALTSGSPDPVSGTPLTQFSKSTKGSDSQLDTFITDAKANALGIVTSQDVKSESGLRREQQIKSEQKALEGKAKQQSDAEEGVKDFRTFLNQYKLSIEELRAVSPDFDRAGFGGLIERTALSLLEKGAELPETSTMLREIDAAANAQARLVEGGRVTDQDRAVYAKLFANTLRSSSDENTSLTANSIINKFHNKGGDILPLLKELSRSEVDVMRKIVTKTIARLPESERARLRKRL